METYDEVDGRTKAGGIVGGTTGITIQNCYNRGDITGNGNSVGGIVGNHEHTNLATIQNCYNTGDITNNKSGISTVGSIMGVAGNANLTRCYSSIDLRMRGSTSGGSNTECAKNLGTSLQGYASMLGAGYKNDNGQNNGYPILAWQ